MYEKILKHSDGYNRCTFRDKDSVSVSMRVVFCPVFMMLFSVSFLVCNHLVCMCPKQETTILENNRLGFIESVNDN